MIIWMLRIILWDVIIKMVMIMRMKMIISVACGAAFGCRVDAIDLNLDTLQLRGHRDNQGANISADIEHDRALPGVWILHGHLDNSFPSMPHGLRNVNCPEHQLGGSEQFARGIEPWESPARSGNPRPGVPGGERSCAARFG